jgi:hypothetical protein
MLSRLKLAALITVVGIAALLPLYGDPRNAPVTHAEWARMLLRGLGMEEAIRQTSTAAQAFAILSWKSSLTFRADRYLTGDDVRVDGEGEQRQVVATGEVGEVSYAVAVVRAGNYSFRVHVAGDPERPVSAELARVGEVTPLGAFTVRPAVAMTWVDAGTAHLDPGAYTASVLLPRGATLENVEVAPPCVVPIEPPNGWKAPEVLTSEDAAVTMVQALDRLSELPPADTPLEIDASQFQTEWSGTPVATSPGGLQSAVQGGTAGTRAIVVVDLPDPGQYTISAFGLTGGGQSWTADACLKSVVCAKKDPRADLAEWRPVLSGPFAAGRHSFSVLLAPGAIIERVRAERKKNTPADYVSTLRRIGFDVGPSGPMERNRAVDAMKFLDHKAAPLKETLCGDVVLPTIPPGSRPGTTVAEIPGSGGATTPLNPGTGPPSIGGSGPGGGVGTIPPTLPPQDVSTPVQPLASPRP